MALVIRDMMVLVENDMIRLKKDLNGEWSVVLWRPATAAELASFSTVKITRDVHATGLRQ